MYIQLAKWMQRIELLNMFEQHSDWTTKKWGTFRRQLIIAFEFVDSIDGNQKKKYQRNFNYELHETRARSEAITGA